MKKDDGGAAFPIRGFENGMTLRDWFAGQALLGYCLNDASEAAEWSYRVADAMIAKRNKGEDK